MDQAPKVTKVGVIHARHVVRAGIRHVLTGQADLTLVDEASGGAVDLVRRANADVMVMSQEAALDEMLFIRTKEPELAVLVLGGDTGAQFAAKLIRMGAKGFLSQDSAPADILEAVRVIARGHRYLTAEVEQLLVDHGQGAAPPHESLSEREFQVLIMLARGITVGEAAKSLKLAVKSVNTYRTRVLDKLQLRSNSDLTYYALKNHLIR